MKRFPLLSMRSYLCQGARGVRVWRQLPSPQPRPSIVTAPPLRVLLVSHQHRRVQGLCQEGPAEPVAAGLNRAPLATSRPAQRRRPGFAGREKAARHGLMQQQ